MSDAEHVASVRNAVLNVYQATCDLDSAERVRPQDPAVLWGCLVVLNAAQKAAAKLVGPRLVEIAQRHHMPDPESWGVPLRNFLAESYQGDPIAGLGPIQAWYTRLHDLAQFLSGPASVPESAATLIPAVPTQLPEDAIEDVYPAGEPIPADLEAAYQSARFLLESSQVVVARLAGDEPDKVTADDVELAAERALGLRRCIKECDRTIFKVTNEITSVNREPVEIASRWIEGFANAHRAALDVAALVCEVVWDGCHRKRGFSSPAELYSLPLDEEAVRSGLPYISHPLRSLLGGQDWRDLKRRLLVERDTAAHARERGSRRVSPSVPGETGESPAPASLPNAAGLWAGDDPTAYRPMKDFLDVERYPDYAAIRRALTSNQWIRWRRPSPQARRREIHAGDWQRMLNQQVTTDPFDLPAETVDAAVKDVERRKAEVRDARK